MVWDLRGALLKKEEFESARLMDFEFRQRARATRRLARDLGLDENDLVARIAVVDEETLLAGLAEQLGRPLAEIDGLYRGALDRARAELVAERGDPTPHRLG